MKSITRFLLLILIIILIYILAFTHVGRYIYWNYADLDDHNKFPADTIQPAEVPFHFTYSKDLIEPYHDDTSKIYDIDRDFRTFLKKNQTVAFIIIRKDSILYEQFFDGYNTSSVIPSFSIAKSVVSALTGIALTEGHIHSVDEPITNYLDGFTHDGFEKITIDDLLSMRSGIRFRESYFNPFGEVPRFYYGKNLKKYTYQLKIKEPPGHHYDYVSANAQLVAFIIEKATGKRISSYLEEKIWKKIGTSHPATWSLDSRKHRVVKAFCCLNVTPYDLAKFGRLYLHEGYWNGQEVIPASWVRESLKIRYPSRDSRGYPYAYMWRSLEDGAAFAKGILGQYLYIDPGKDLIMLRFGHSSNDIDWVKIFEEIKSQL